MWLVPLSAHPARKVKGVFSYSIQFTFAVICVKYKTFPDRACSYIGKGKKDILAHNIQMYMYFSQFTVQEMSSLRSLIPFTPA